MHRVFDEIADNLAEQGLAVVDQFLSQNEVNDILESEYYHKARSILRRAGIGKNEGHQVNEAIRGDYIHWLNHHHAPPPFNIYLTRLRQLQQFLNHTLFLCLRDFEIHLTTYPPGTFYKRHLDQFKKDDHRKLSVICYLNNDWQECHGGQLRIFRDGQVLDVLPLSGRLVCFRSDQIEHEVLPATRERLSLTGWMLDQVAELRHL